MADGYIRQSAGSIVTGAVIRAAHFNAEFNQLQAAFSGATGHDHSGGAGEGPIISPTGGGTPIFLADAITGTATAIVIAHTLPDNFTLSDRYAIYFRPTAINTGPVTVNVAGTGAIPLKKVSPTGYTDLDPGDLATGQFTFATYDANANVFQSVTTIYVGKPVVTGVGFILDFSSLFKRYVMTAISTITLPSIITLPQYFYFEVQAKGGDVTITPNGTDIIQGGIGGASYTIPQGTSAVIYIGDNYQWYANGTSQVQPIGSGGTSSTTASAARTALGLAIGTNVQAFDSTLSAFAGYNTNGLITQTAADTFTGRTLTGTSGTISITNGSGVSGNPTITIDATYIGQSSITTLGTISTGVWNGTTIAIANGGTGQTTANTAFNALVPSQTSNSGKYLTTNGTNTSWGTVAAGFTDPGANGIVIRTSLNTSTARTLTGTSAEITVTNGDGTGGNPTLSLPTALTFTGKTVTGGTFTTPTINVNDDVFSIRDNGDTTKILQFQLSGITTGNTRTLTIPDVSGTITIAGIKTVTRQIITTTGSSTYTPTAGMVYCIVEVLGGGGGGGNVTSGANATAAGGGAGGYGKSILSAATVGASKTVVVGVAGGNATAGGTSSFGAIISCTGGQPGTTNGTGNTISTLGGAGGASTGADFNVTGDSGDCSCNGGSVGGANISGKGASSLYGSGARSVLSGANGDNATGFGAGGSGAFGNGQSGGSGTQGIVIVTEYCT